MKKCPKCEKVFPPTTEHFYSDSRIKSGLRSICKHCHDASSARYYNEHKEQVLAWHQKHHLSHKAEHNARTLRYQQTPQGTVNHNIANQRYLQTARGRMGHRVRENRRRSRKHGNGGSFTPEQFQEQIERQKHKCYYCRKRFFRKDFPWHAEHVVPISRGGTSDIANIVAACSHCNLSKNNKLPHEWVKGGRLI